MHSSIAFIQISVFCSHVAMSANEEADDKEYANVAVVDDEASLAEEEGMPQQDSKVSLAP